MNILPLNFVVALPAEAKPINTYFGLKRQQPDGAFPVYQNGAISLVLSGVGIDAAAQATQFLFERNGERPGDLWINLGIAGHASLEIGECILAKRVANESGDSWKVELPAKLPCIPADLLTLNQPNFDYSHPGAYDMEAAGFFPIALGFTRVERVHCFKVISDNGEHPGHGIKAKTVSRLIAARLDRLSQFIEQLQT